MEPTSPSEPCGCGLISVERNRYFTGKPMAARDFTDEQEYFLSRNRLHNRLLHGWGVVCGLQVGYHPRRECRDRWIVVTGGIALDCCGRELILPRRITQRIDLPDPKDWEPPPDGLLVYLEYAEELTECGPVLYHEPGCGPARTEPGRVREAARVRVEPFDPDDAGCWKTPGGGRVPFRDDCDEELPGSGGSCLEPDCPCGGKVPLALLTFGEANPFAIDTAGVTRLAPPADYLTHITGINWSHGGEVTLAELEAEQRQLRVSFDRRLRPSEDDGSGINRYTFLVQYGNVQRDLEFLTPDSEPQLEEDGSVAVFTIDADYFRPRTNIAGSTVFVTLKCDFVLDCHDNAVDGDHIGGRLPSGNGTAGGVFESWFHVVTEPGRASR